MRPSMAQARAAFRDNRETSAARGSPRIKRSWQSSCLLRCHYLNEIGLDYIAGQRDPTGSREGRFHCKPGKDAALEPPPARFRLRLNRAAPLTQGGHAHWSRLQQIFKAKRPLRKERPFL